MSKLTKKEISVILVAIAPTINSDYWDDYEDNMPLIMQREGIKTVADIKKYLESADRKLRNELY